MRNARDTCTQHNIFLLVKKSNKDRFVGRNVNKSFSIKKKKIYMYSCTLLNSCDGYERMKAAYIYI